MTTAKITQPSSLTSSSRFGPQTPTAPLSSEATSTRGPKDGGQPGMTRKVIYCQTCRRASTSSLATWATFPPTSGLTRNLSSTSPFTALDILFPSKPGGLWTKLNQRATTGIYNFCYNGLLIYKIPHTDSEGGPIDAITR